MDTNIILIITLILLFVSLLSGMPVAAGLAITGLIGSSLLQGGSVVELGYLVWAAVNKWSLLAVPGFVVMGILFSEHRFGEDAFETTYRWLGRMPGGLIISSVAMAALFAFVSGSAVAGAATIGSLAIPEVEKRGFDRRLSLGAFCIAGTLAVLIPPSLVMIIYATMAEVSLGAMFFAGIVPGIILALLIILYVISRALLNPALAPLGPSFTWKERISPLGRLAPLILTFLIVLGGIYMGVWSATEASAAGTVCAFIICLAYRRASLSSLQRSLYGAIRISCMIYMIVIGAYFFSNFLFRSGFDQILVNFVTNLALPNWAIAVVILIIMTIMGCFMDVMALLLISIPVFLPIAEAVGISPILFGVIMILATELALITPPVGVNLYVIRDLAPRGTKISDVILGTLPYVVIVWILFALLLSFPQLALFLPSTMVVR